jgi:hypothetical protein
MPGGEARSASGHGMLSMSDELFISAGEEVVRVLPKVSAQMPEASKRVVRESGVPGCAAPSPDRPHVVLM